MTRKFIEDKHCRKGRRSSSPTSRFIVVGTSSSCGLESIRTLNDSTTIAEFEDLTEDQEREIFRTSTGNLPSVERFKLKFESHRTCSTGSRVIPRRKTSSPRYTLLSMDIDACAEARLQCRRNSELFQGLEARQRAGIPEYLCIGALHREISLADHLCGIDSIVGMAQASGRTGSPLATKGGRGVPLLHPTSGKVSRCRHHRLWQKAVSYR